MTNISIIISVLEDTHIHYALTNLLNLSDLNTYEIICVSNSNNKNLNYLNEMSLNHDFKLIITEETDNSMGKLKNIGLKNATSDFVVFFDLNRFISKTYYNQLLNGIIDFNLDLVGYCNKKLTCEKKCINKEDNICYGTIRDIPVLFENTDLNSYIFNLNFIKDNNIHFDEELYESDEIFLLEFYLSSSKLGILFENEYTTNISIKKENIQNNSYNHKYIKHILKLMNKLLILSKKNNYIGVFVHNYLSNWLISFVNDIISKSNVSLTTLNLISKEGNLLLEEVIKQKVDLSITNEYLFKSILYNNKNIYNLINNEDVDKKNKVPMLNEINVATIMDPFTYNSFSSEFNIIPLEPDTWLNKFEENNIDLFICESVWNGVGEQNIVDGIALETGFKPWEKKIVDVDTNIKESGKEIFDILKYCKKKGIPTIFWNKEDPTSFDRFINVAIHFDYIFTTDEGSIEKYKARGHKNTHTLLFASQIKLFNPIETNERSNNVIFAGSWYREFPQRCNIMDNIFKKILNANYSLKIYDRQSNSLDSSRHYPNLYLEYVHPGVPFNKMPQVYKESKYAININTITESETMFSRRIFELMSSNTFVITNFSKGIFNLFRNNVVYLDKIDKLELDEKYVNKICEENLYNVLEYHTYHQRFKHILDTIHFDYNEKTNKIHILYKVESTISLERIINDFNTLKYQYKICVIVSDNDLKIENTNITNNLRHIKKTDLLKYFDSLNEKDYILIRDIEKNLDEKFFKEALLHYQYIDKRIPIKRQEKKYNMINTTERRNILFNSIRKEIITNYFSGKYAENEMIIYTI